MKRTAFVILCMALFAGTAAAQDLRVEIGLGGVYPAGEWTWCRISGLTDVPDGGVLILRVGDVFERRMSVTKGAAEGFILIPDVNPAITLEWPGHRPTPLAPEVARRLVGVKDKLPVIFVGDDAPSEADVQKTLGAKAIVPIHMSYDALMQTDVRATAFVWAYAFGDLSDDQVKRFTERYPKWRDLAIVSVREYAGLGARWEGGDLEPGPFVYGYVWIWHTPIPKGSLRADLYQEWFDNFGAPAWSRSVRREVALCFGGMLVAFALAVVLSRRTRLVAITLGLAFCLSVLLAAQCLRIPPSEAEMVLERHESDGPEGPPEGSRKAVTLTSVEALRADRDNTLLCGLGIAGEAVPVMAWDGQWSGSPVMVDEMGRVTRRLPAPSRQLMVTHASLSLIPPRTSR